IFVNSAPRLLYDLQKTQTEVTLQNHTETHPFLGRVPAETIQKAVQRPLVITPYTAGDLDCLRKFHILSSKGSAFRNRPSSGAATFSKALHRVLAQALHPGFGTPPHVQHIRTWARDAI